MFFLALSFLAGVLSVFAACILPLLPVIVGGSLAVGGSRKRMYTIVGALAISIIAFTLLLKASTVLIGVPESFWRYLSGGIIVVLGIFILFPAVWARVPGLNVLNRSSNKLLAAGYKEGGFWGDSLMGVALGPVFASCSPTYFIILATVLPVEPILGFVYLVAYAGGLSLALLLIAILGEKLVQKLGIALNPESWFYRGIGAVLIIVGVLIVTGLMRDIEVWFVERGYDATFIELKLLGANRESAPADMTTTFVSADMKAGMYEKAPEIVSPAGFINTRSTSSGQAEPITIGEFAGKKVVLVDFWTYSCINCQRTFPYLRAWHEAYADEGLVIIGIHTPEFAFEKISANVSAAAEMFGLEHPIVLDNDYATWRAFGNNYWPRKYLIDIDGYIVYDHIGEGAYAETEAAIQKALAERAARLGEEMPDITTGTPVDTIPMDETKVGSPETYFGAARNDNFGSGPRGKTGTQFYEEPQTVLANTLYLIGKWDITDEYAQTSSDVGSLSVGSDRVNYLYSAKQVYFVAGSGTGKAIEMEVLRDSAPLTESTAGKDVYFKDGKSYVRINENRLYHIIGDSTYGTHLLEFIISQPGLQAYTFTFG